MGSIIDFIELAKDCKDEKKASCAEKEKKWYHCTFYAAIFNDDKLIVSATPHILRDAQKCILIHEMSYLAVTLTYSCDNVQILNSDGVVTNNDLGDGFKIGISRGSYNDPPKMYIDYQDKRLFSTNTDFNGNNKWDWSKILPDIWKLYLRLKKECVNVHEMKMLCDIVKKDNEIVDLNEKLDQEKYMNQQKDLQIQAYKSLLDEIKNMMEQHHE